MAHPEERAMVRSHYLDVTDGRGPGGSPHPSRCRHVAAAVVSAVHAANSSAADDTTRIAIAFPGLLDASPFPAGFIRIFGSSGQMDAIRERLATHPELARDGIQIKAVTAVPKQHRTISFVRSRRPERETLSFNERALRRAQRLAMQRIASGETLDKAPAGLDERIVESNRRIVEGVGAEVSINVTLSSSSTGQRFSLWIAAVDRSKCDTTPVIDSYGLSRRSETTGVPHF